jgi:cytoplasmic iron level regulating protein YaaA (DUF328/UPF0246 family)
MQLILSPSKTQDFTDYNLPKGVEPSPPLFINKTLDLVASLKALNPSQISKLMSLSEKLTDLNFDRFQTFSNKFNTDTSKPALLAFQGDVYRDIHSSDYSKDDWIFANQTIRILSGLYGLVRPLDFIQPYRLEMKTKLKTQSSPNLYKFWGDTLARSLELENSSDPILINLASNEYSKALLPHLKKTRVIHVSFKDKKKDAYKVIAIYSKLARGHMAQQIVANRIKSPEGIKQLNVDGYRYSKQHSSDSEYVFLRG